MEKSESNIDGSVREIWVASGVFARYAQEDLDRWRQLIGHRVQHADSRWGTGIVEDISWGSPCDHVPAYVQVRICYDGGWTVVVHSETWHKHHEQVAVSAQVDTAIHHCLDTALTEEEQDECLAKHSRQLRERRDRDLLARAANKRQQAPRIGESATPSS